MKQKYTRTTELHKNVKSKTSKLISCIKFPRIRRMLHFNEKCLIDIPLSVKLFFSQILHTLLTQKSKKRELTII